MKSDPWAVHLAGRAGSSSSSAAAPALPRRGAVSAPKQAKADISVGSLDVQQRMDKLELRMDRLETNLDKGFDRIQDVLMSLKR